MKEIIAFSLLLTILKVSGTAEIEWWLVLMPLIMTLAVVLAVLLFITAEIYCGMGYKDMPQGFKSMERGGKTAMNNAMAVAAAVVVCECCAVTQFQFTRPTTNHQEIQNTGAKMVYLKSGGEFANWCKISTSADYDRAVNIRNIATLRKIEGRRLLVDNNLVILFSDSVEREAFIKAVAE